MYKDCDIQGKEFRIENVSAMESLQMFNRVTKMINKPLSKISGVDFNQNKTTQELVVLFSDVISSLDETDFTEINKWIKKYVHINIDKDIISRLPEAYQKQAQEGDWAPLKTDQIFEAALNGRMSLHLEVIMEFLKVNFLECFQELAKKKNLI